MVKLRLRLPFQYKLLVIVLLTLVVYQVSQINKIMILKANTKNAISRKVSAYKDSFKSAEQLITIKELGDDKNSDDFRDGSALLSKPIVSHPLNGNRLLKRSSPAHKMNATLISYITTRNYPQILASVRSITENFNIQYQYDWVFISHKLIPTHLQQSISQISTTNIYFVQLKYMSNLFGYSTNINIAKSNEVRRKMRSKVPKKINSIEWRHLNRFMCGDMYKLPILDNYRYYFKVPLTGTFSCITEDPFVNFHLEERKYGYANLIKGDDKYAGGLIDFIQDYIMTGVNLNENNNFKHLINTDEEEKKFSNVNFDTDFEMGDLEFFRSTRYQDFVNLVNTKGGFYYETWQESSIKTIAISMFMNKQKDLKFLEVFYKDGEFDRCPIDKDYYKNKSCDCNPTNQFTETNQNNILNDQLVGFINNVDPDYYFPAAFEGDLNWFVVDDSDYDDDDFEEEGPLLGPSFYEDE